VSDDAELARSILACPRSAEIAVDGFPALDCGDGLGLRDADGTPRFACPTRSPMADAGRAGSKALLTLASGLGPDDGPERELSLTLAGTLAAGPVESCSCCGEERQDVGLEPELVVLGRGHEQVRVPLRAFRSPALRLNRGYLQRALRHANACHRADLAEVVTRMTGTPSERLLDAGLADLTRQGAELTWIDREGGHRATLWFSRTARTVEELGVLLQRELHAGIC
jgi:hypothetical protein